MGRGWLTVGSRIRFEAASRGPAAGVAGAVCLVIALARVEASPLMDRGIFLSVAAGLNRGERLYVDIFDNKDPLFYFSQAVAFRLGGETGPFALDVALLLAAGLAAFAIATSLFWRPTTAIVVAAGTTALLTSSPWYMSGYSQLLGITLFLASLATAMRHRPALAGVFAGSMVCSRAAFVLLLPALVLAAVPSRGPGSLLRLRSFSAGTAAATVTVIGALAARGELLGYVEALRSNGLYARTALAVVYDRAGPPTGTVRKAVADLGASVPGVALGAATVLALGVSAAVVVQRLRRHRSVLGPATSRFATVTLAAGMGLLGTVALTHLWHHHMQALVLFAVLGGVLLGALLRRASGDVRYLAATCSCAVMLVAADVTALPGQISRLPSANERLTVEEGDLQPVLRSLISTGVGASDGTVTLGVAGFPVQGVLTNLPGNTRFACRYMNPYPWYSAEVLAGYLDCLRRRPDIVAYHPRGHAKVFDTFHRPLQIALVSLFVPAATTTSGWTIWVRKALPIDTGTQ